MATRKPKKLTYLVMTAVIHITIFVAGGYVLLLNKWDETPLRTETQENSEPFSIDYFTIQAEPRRQFVEIQGRVRAEQRLEIYPEMQGRIVPGDKQFREGIEFSKGETILHLDDEESRLQLFASRSSFQTLITSLMPDISLDYPEHLNRYEQWFESLHPEEQLTGIPDFNHSRMERFLTSRGVYNRYYQIRSAEHRLEKFTVKAPFAGILSSAKAEPGQSVGPQIHAGTFIDPESFLLTATVRQPQLRSIEIGDTVELSDQHRTHNWTATIARINPLVDPRTQTVEIYLAVGGNGIREGMYLEGQLVTGDPIEIAEIPKSALLRNGYVYSITDHVIDQKPVHVEDIGHKSVWVSGLEDGDRIILDAEIARAGQIIREGTP